MSGSPGLKKALNQRQLRKIAIGGVIGAGLFVGSGVVTADTGPGVFIAYALSGVLIIMVLADAGRDGGGQTLDRLVRRLRTRRAGALGGFSVGWLYWYFWVIVVGFEAIAGAKIIQYWIDVPLWVSALVFMILMTATNLFSVKSYGEFEFWFAGIKEAAILAFIAIGVCFVLGLWPDKSMDFSNLWSHGGFMPMGVGVITVGIVTVIFSMVGAEIATIAAAESAGPREGGGEGRQLDDPANPALLRRVRVLARDDRAVEQRRISRLAVRRRVHGDGDSLRHERRGADGGVELPEFGDVHGLSHAVRPRRTPRVASSTGPGHAPGRGRERDSGVVGRRVPMRDFLRSCSIPAVRSS